MSAKVLDFYRAKAKQLVNRSFKAYGALPGGCVHDLIFVHIHGQQVNLTYWEGILVLCSTERMREIAQSAITECKRLIAALEALEQEYKTQHNNDLEYTCI